MDTKPWPVAICNGDGKVIVTRNGKKVEQGCPGCFKCKPNG